MNLIHIIIYFEVINIPLKKHIVTSPLCLVDMHPQLSNSITLFIKMFL
jgi:hypothetical protein